ncbi:unnamed protein product [Lymnaea stagnalis]|uniref:Uncharacterized protein n=1 Tax=Lymnaea stagnalis TaxID=6523 RepID=A0AAV2HEX2_LYMST
MSCWSPNSQQPRRKACPDGSYAFQKVLDEFLTAQDGCSDNSVTLSEDHVSASQQPGDHIQEHIGLNNDLNNNREKACAGDARLSSCDVELCTQDDTDTALDGFSKILNKPNSTGDLRLPQIAQISHEMGTSCSSNFYDRRDWNNVADGCPADHLKNGRRGRVSKKQLSLCNQPDDPNSALPVACTCSFKTNASKGPNTKVTPDKISSLSPGDVSDQCTHQPTSHWMSSNAESSGHVKLSRAVGTGRSRASSSCDVSPHRLLTRRNNSPSPRTSSMDGCAGYSAMDAMRQRSHSWSNGKLGSRSTYLRSAPMTRSSVLSPIGQHKSVSPNPSLNKHKELSSNTMNPTVPKTISANSPTQSHHLHGPDCPLNGQSNDVSRLENSVSFDDSDSCLSPVLRHRSASESHTTRPRRLLPHTPDSNGGLNCQEHVHVRWADEEKGSSLSTSVFLTSIRPRSYSYGAADGAPQRPILKKVAGL